MGSVFRAPGRRRRAAAFLAFALAPAAHAQTPEPPFSLSWSAPDDCPNEAALRAEVTRLAPEAASGVPGFSARGVVIRTEAGYELELETLYGERHGSRRVQDGSCTEVTRAAAVVIALAIRPDSAAAEPPDASPPPAPPPPANAEIQPADAPAPAPLPVAKAPDEKPAAAGKLPLELWVAAAFTGEVGTLPGFAPGVSFSIEARTAWLRFGLGGEILPTQRTTADSAGAPELEVSYWGGEVFGCFGLMSRRLAPGACAGLGVGKLQGRSPNATVPGEGSTLWITPRLGGFVRYRLLPVLDVGAEAYARFPVKEASFTVENFGVVYETAPVAALLLAGASVRFW